MNFVQNNMNHKLLGSQFPFMGWTQRRRNKVTGVEKALAQEWGARIFCWPFQHSDKSALSIHIPFFLSKKMRR